METLSIPGLATKVTDEDSAYRLMEELRWHGKPVCPHCGVIDENHYLLKPRNGARTTRNGNVTHRRLWKCRACRHQFSVLVGTIFHRSKVPLRTWLFVIFELVSSKNGVSSREIERKYGLTPKTAWFLLHRIREGMKRGGAQEMLTGTVVADEAYIGGKPRYKSGTLRARMGEKHYPPKAVVFTLVNPDTGEARSRVVPDVTAVTLHDAIMDEVDPDQSRLMTDEHRPYGLAGRFFRDGHDTVFHGGGEYVRGDISTNAVEQFFGQLKRSIDGTHHAVSHEHLHRYLAEFDFRYSTRNMTDSKRMERLLGQVHGKRLTYRQPTGR